MKFPSIVRETDGWETVRREVRHSDPWTELAVETVRSPAQPVPRTWTVVHRKAAAVVAPRTAGGGFVLVRQERIPIRGALWEFPAGQIDETGAVDDAVIRATALRELAEETGHELAPDGELVPLGHFFTSPGFTDEHGFLFLATAVRPTGAGHAPDHGESIVAVREFPAEELCRMIAAGEICDANTLATFARLAARGLF